MYFHTDTGSVMYFDYKSKPVSVKKKKMKLKVKLEILVIKYASDKINP